MSDPSFDLKDELVSAGVGTFASTTGWGIYISIEPTSPDSVITIYNTGSFGEPNPKFLMDNQTVQIRIRGDIRGYQAAFTKAQAIKDALLGLSKTINGTKYVGIWMLSDIIFLAYDDNNRPIFTTNWRIIAEPASGTNRVALT